MIKATVLMLIQRLSLNDLIEVRRHLSERYREECIKMLRSKGRVKTVSVKRAPSCS